MTEPENGFQTPPEIVSRARLALGGWIDLDPASCQSAQKAVHANAWYGPGAKCIADGRALDWYGRIFLNPPGGKLDRKTLEPIVKGPGVSSAAVWWEILLEHFRAGRVDRAIFVCFNVETLRTTQERGCGILDYASALCLPAKRLCFIDPKTGQPAKSPTKANAIVGLYRDDEGWRDFTSGFRGLGSLVNLDRGRQVNCV